MPNWCYNELEISREAAEKYLLAKGEEGDIIDFNKLIPMPESIAQTESGGSNQTDIYIYLSGKLQKTNDEVFAEYGELLRKVFLRKIKAEDLKKYRDTITEKQFSAEETDARYESGKKLMENYRLYGAVSWYEWACLNWGSKWNAGETEVIELENGMVALKFETPWAPPVGIIRKLSEAADFVLSYYGEDIGCFLAKDKKLSEAHIEERVYDADEADENAPEYTLSHRETEIADGTWEYEVYEQASCWDETKNQLRTEEVTVAVICLHKNGDYTVVYTDEHPVFPQEEIDSYIADAVCFEALRNCITEVRRADAAG